MCLKQLLSEILSQAFLASYCPQLENILRHTPSWPCSLILLNLGSSCPLTSSSLRGHGTQHCRDSTQTVVTPGGLCLPGMVYPIPTFTKLPKQRSQAARSPQPMPRGPVVMIGMSVLKTEVASYSSSLSHSPSRSVAEHWKATHVQVQ